MLVLPVLVGLAGYTRISLRIGRAYVIGSKSHMRVGVTRYGGYCQPYHNALIYYETGIPTTSSALPIQEKERGD